MRKLLATSSPPASEQVAARLPRAPISAEPRCSVICPDAEPPPLPGAPPAGETPLPASRAERIAGLRRSIAAVSANPQPAGASTAPAWSLGVGAADARLAAGLAIDGVHEVKPALFMPAGGMRGEATQEGQGSAATREAKLRGGVAAADRAAAVFFALALVRRRLGERAAARGIPQVLWCEPRHDMRELGRLHAPGLAAFGLAPGRLMLVETRHPDEALWAMEEGLRSGALSLAVGFVPDIALTPARRLALAAERFCTPCLLLTGARAPPAAATATRWRIGRAESAPHAFDADAPGLPRLSVVLERCRGYPLAAEQAFNLEWSDEAFRFSMAAGMADRAHAPGRAVAAGEGWRGFGATGGGGARPEHRGGHAGSSVRAAG